MLITEFRVKQHNAMLNNTILNSFTITTANQLTVLFYCSFFSVKYH